MQKKNPKTAQRAKAGTAGKTGNTGSTGHTGKTGRKEGTQRKSLTDAQRAAKRIRDRKYKARLKARRIEAAKAFERPGQSEQQNTCGAGRQECGGRSSAMAAFATVGRLLLGDMLEKMGVPLDRLPLPELLEPGVVRQRVVLPDGRKASLVLVDGEAVDPLSEYSPLPPEARRRLLLRRMAKEISEIVDSHLELS